MKRSIQEIFNPVTVFSLFLMLALFLGALAPVVFAQDDSGNTDARGDAVLERLQNQFDDRVGEVREQVAETRSTRAGKTLEDAIEYRLRSERYEEEGQMGRALNQIDLALRNLHRASVMATGNVEEAPTDSALDLERVQDALNNTEERVQDAQTLAEESGVERAVELAEKAEVQLETAKEFYAQAVEKAEEGESYRVELGHTVRHLNQANAMARLAIRLAQVEQLEDLPEVVQTALENLKQLLDEATIIIEESGNEMALDSLEQAIALYDRAVQQYEEEQYRLALCSIQASTNLASRAIRLAQSTSVVDPVPAE